VDWRLRRWEDLKVRRLAAENIRGWVNSDNEAERECTGI
jgi:hypothetical protein